MTYCSLICTPESFRSSDCSRVRWLDWENDYPLSRAYWPQDPPIGACGLGAESCRRLSLLRHC